MQSKHTAAICIALIFSGCSEAEVSKEKFTLSSGVNLEDAGKCEQPQMQADGILEVSRRASANEYLLKVRATFTDCASSKLAPFLSISKNGKSTLQLMGAKPQSGCACQRTVKLRILDRLQPKETLYVAAGEEVVGHVTVP
jgi:hypothetical protein